MMVYRKRGIITEIGKKGKVSFRQSQVVVNYLDWVDKSLVIRSGVGIFVRPTSRQDCWKL